MYSISFIKDEKPFSIKSNNVLGVYIKLLSWLDNNGYKFDGEVHNNFVKGVFNNEQLKKILDDKKYLKKSMFHEINDSGKFIQISEGNIPTRFRYMKEMLENFGIDPDTIKTDGFETKPRKIRPYTNDYEKDDKKENKDMNVSFTIDDDYEELSSNTWVGLFRNVIDYVNEYNGFEGYDETTQTKKILSKEEIDELIKNSLIYESRHFYKIKDDHYMFTRFNQLNTRKRITDLLEFIKAENIEFSDNSDQSIDELDKGESEDFDPTEDLEPMDKKMTFIEASQVILKQNNNNPMSASEIWKEIEEQDLVETSGKTPIATLNAIIVQYSSNAKVKNKKEKEIFKIVEQNPYKFILLDPNDEIQHEEEDFELTPPSSATRIKRFDIEGDLKQAQAQADRSDILPFSRFRKPLDYKQVQGEPEKVKHTVLRENPFKQSLCVLGESGAGKSYTIENILENENHEYKFIIPTASSTGILSQFSPSENRYILSKLGKMLIEAADNPDKLYTAVFDEFHKPTTIEMINDELLQAISTKRNRFRFISLDSETVNLYKNSNLVFERGNIKIPDNFGFIFISSKPKVISNNPDLFRRLEFVEIKKEDRNIRTIDELKGKIIPKEERDKLLNKREE